MTEFQKQTAMDIKHHQNRAAWLNSIESLTSTERAHLEQSLDILADPHKGHNSSNPNCQCGCREVFA